MWINVIGRPYAEIIPLTLTVRRGDNFSVTCDLVTDMGDPLLPLSATMAATQFTWFANGQPTGRE